MQTILLRASRGVRQEWRFEVSRDALGMQVRSYWQVAGQAPKRGACVLTPLPADVVERWLESQIARLSRSSARFVRCEPEDDIHPWLLDPAQAFVAVLGCAPP